MPRKEPKSEIVAFKVEKDLAEFLNKLPNKSDFIRKAIIAQFGMACPLCAGTGVVPRGVHNHYKPLLGEHNTRSCARCGAPQTFPLSVEALESVAADERERLEQFLHGGPLYCAACYPDVPECDDCGWHIPHEEVADHIRKVHAH
jgi:hypothetical protein